jgi:hypothetical protein
MNYYQKISPLAFGLSLGVLWCLCVVVISLTALHIGYGVGMINALSALYFGLDLTAMGIAIGAAWSFVDAFIGGFLIAYLYNLVLKLTS